MSEPLVSIIIPAYNSAAYLAETIRSALDQTWPYKEIIVVDNNSADSSLEVASGFAPDVKVFTETQQGASAARNRGLQEARGNFIQFLDADDLLSPDKIEAQINRLRGFPNHVAIGQTAHFFNGEDHRQAAPVPEWLHADHEDPVDFLTKLYAGEDTLPGYGGMVAVHAWLTPRHLIEKAGYWNEELSLDDDGDYFCRVVLASQGIKFSQQGISYYRKFRDSKTLSAQRSERAIVSAIKAIDLKFSYLKSKTHNPLVDKEFAKHYWWTGVMAYPQHKALSKYCIDKAKELGYKGERYVGGRSGHLLAAIIGWKMARKLASWRHS